MLILLFDGGKTHKKKKKQLARQVPASLSGWAEKDLQRYNKFSVY